MPGCRGVRLLFAAALVVAAACNVPDSEYFGHVATGAELDPRVFRWCNFSDPDHLDPALASSTASSPLVSALFDALTTYGFDGNPVPSLATHWEIGADLRTFTFHLREDARWSNGRPVTAYDVAYAAFRVTDAALGSPNADNLSPIRGAMATLARRRYVLRAPVGGLPVGAIVELSGAGDPPGDPNRRTAPRSLALRDLGAAENAAYATVPAGDEVGLVMESGARATWPSPGPSGEPWAYVRATVGSEEVLGWVPRGELAGEPAADLAFTVHAEGSAAPGDLVAHGRDLVRSTDGLGITVPDAHTIIFTTAEPTPFFLPITDNRALRTVPIEAVSRSPVHWTDPARIVTSGPLHLTSWRLRDGLTLVKSPTYWDQTAVHVERLEVLSIDDQAAATNLYFSGACDAMTPNLIPSTYLPVLSGEVRGRPYRDYQITPNLAVYFAWVNTKRFPNVHLRRALALAVDRRVIPRFTHGGEVPSAQLTPGTPIAMLSAANLRACGVTRETPGVALIMTDGELCYVPPPGLDYDLAAAQRELAIARQELGAAFPTTLEYRYNAGAEAHKQIAEYLQASWAALGLDVTLASEDFNAMLADSKTGKFDVLRLGQQGNVADTESEFLPLFLCSSPDNRGGYCNPEYDRLMAAAGQVVDRKARNALLHQAEAVMIGDAPVIPLYVYTLKTLVKPYVRDYGINVIGQPPLWRAYVDPSWHP